MQSFCPIIDIEYLAFIHGYVFDNMIPKRKRVLNNLRDIYIYI